MLCKIKDNNAKSVCESGDEVALTDIIKDVFIDDHSKLEYHFGHDPLNLDGQTGVPQIVDEILGKKTTFQCSCIFLEWLYVLLDF